MSPNKLIQIIIMSFLLVAFPSQSFAEDVPEKSIDLEIGVKQDDTFEFEIRTIEGRDFDIRDFMTATYSHSFSTFHLSEGHFTIKIQRILSDSPTNVCFDYSTPVCIKYRPIILIEMNSESITFSGRARISTIPFGVPITTTNWELVNTNLKNQTGEALGWLDKYQKIESENSLQVEDNVVTIKLIISALYNNSDYYRPRFQSQSFNSTSLYNSKTGVLLSYYAERQYVRFDGSYENEVIDIVNTDWAAGENGFLDVPILLSLQTAMILVVVGLFYRNKNRKP